MSIQHGYSAHSSEKSHDALGVRKAYRQSSEFLLLTRAGPVLRNFRGRPGGGASRRPPPSNSAPGRRSEKRKKAFESSSKIISKLFQSIFAQVNIEVTRGHQRSNDTNGFSLITFELRKLEK